MQKVKTFKKRLDKLSDVIRKSFISNKYSK